MRTFPVFCLGLGTLLGLGLPVLLPLPACLLALPLAWWAWRAPRWAALVMLALGILFVQWQGHERLQQRWPVALENRVLPWRGCVVGSPLAWHSGGRAEWQFPALGLDDHRTLQMTLDAGLGAVTAGQCYEFHARIRRPRGLSSPGLLPREAWYLGQGIDGVARVRSLQPLPEQALPWITGQALAWRQAWLQRLAGLPVSPHTAATLQAMLGGWGSALPAADWDLLAATGTTHLLVVSGLHVGFAAAVGYALGYGLGLLLALAGMPWPAHRFATGVSLFTGCAFGVLSGAGVAALRACLMLSLAGACLCFGHLRQAGPAMVLAWTLLLVVNPWFAGLPGFWLSFGAVAALWLAVAGRRLTGWQAMWRTQWGVGIGLLPWLLLFGKPLASAGWLVNVLAIPMCSALVMGLLALLALGGGVPAVIWSGVDWLVQAGWQSLQWVSLQGISEAVWWPGPPGIPAFILVVGASVCWLLPCSWRCRLLGCCCLLPWLWPAVDPIPEAGLVVHVLDVGQGQAVLLQTRQHTLLYDAGPAQPDGWNAAEMVLWPMLARSGVRSLDGIMISHADLDHAGGRDWIHARFPVAPISASQPQAGETPCRQGQQWVWDGVQFTVLHPAQAGHDRNNDSCVLQVRAGGWVGLLPGDIERPAEYTLVQQFGAPLRADWLLAPHHGSLTSSSWPFAKAVSPQRVVFSAGYHSRFGHPAPAVVGRWQALGSETRVTASCGTYTLWVDGAGQIRENCHRQQGRPFWVDP